MSSTRTLPRITTGVHGLDFLLGGGLFQTGVYIVQGGAGSGKTIFANQVCFHQAAQQKRAVYYTLLTESHDRMMAFLQPLAFFEPKQIPNAVNYVSGFKILENEGLPGVLRSIRDVVAAQKPTLLVVDGVVTAEEIAPNDTAFKKFLHELQTLSTMFRCTTLLLTNTDAAKRLHAEHTMVDGIIELRSDVGRFQAHRAIEVSKFRGGGQQRGPHTFEISDEGIRIFPRIETILRPAGERPRPTERTRAAFGIERLDRVLEGGLPTSSNTMLLGASGTGKTVLGLHFLDAAAARGERGMFFTFYEQRDELIEKARRFGLEAFARGVEDGQIEVIWHSSVEANVDHIGNRLLASYQRIKPARVVIDGLHGFQVTVDPAERVQDFFAAMADHFMVEHSTILFTSETPDLVGQRSIHPPFPNASRICQNIVVIRYAELQGRVERVLSVIKMRDSNFDPSLHMLTIGSRGIELGELTTEADMLLGGQPRRTWSPTGA
ncbi:MAG TPA: ATPase domain-containing protein [Kofleriaceae bacterium]|nr:ATPase domain-containing protein [Kofleriaceae bacterium]